MPKMTSILIGALVLVYVALRLWRLTDSCLWFDEIFSVHAAGHDWTGMLRFVAQDLVHPPLFYAVLKVWIGLGGDGLFWLRLLPVLFSVLAIVPFLYLCREMKFESSVAVLALFFLAVNGSLIKYTQTLRMYSMLMFLSLLSIWLFARYFNRGKSWIWLVLANVLLVHTHYFGWLVVGAEFLAILVFQRIKFARMASMAAIVAAAFIPWMIAVWSAAKAGSDLGQNIAWQTRPGIRELWAYLLDLAEPIYFQASSTEPGSIYLVSIPMLLLITIAAGIYFAFGSPDEARTRTSLLLMFALFPALIGFVISWAMPHSVWGARHLVMVTPIAAILFASVTASLNDRIVRFGIISAMVVLTAIATIGVALRETPRYVWCAWESVAADIRSEQPAGTIYAFENLVAYHLWFAERESGALQVKVVKGVDVSTADETYFLPRGFYDVATVPLAEVNEDEFWLAFRPVRRSDDARLIEVFTRLGYTSCTRNEEKYDRSTVFWLKFAKDPRGCATPFTPN